MPLFCKNRNKSTFDISDLILGSLQYIYIYIYICICIYMCVCACVRARVCVCYVSYECDFAYFEENGKTASTYI